MLYDYGFASPIEEPSELSHRWTVTNEHSFSGLVEAIKEIVKQCLEMVPCRSEELVAERFSLIDLVENALSPNLNKDRILLTQKNEEQKADSFMQNSYWWGISIAGTDPVTIILIEGCIKVEDT